MLVSRLQCLTSHATYHDLALRCHEFLHYQRQGRPDQAQLAEDLLYNLLVEYLVCAGVPREKAEHFCLEIDNLTELALRIGSTLGPVATF
ncbi:MAG: hypothetical protein HC929_25630 [Leptolyngbyaceae cyanobacterium SM2_5_2]|nr:hypothetical protein [Leptolyngbyaceae cyanobacterium SM2_5_2]